MPSLAIAVRIFAIAFSVTAIPFAVACGADCSIAIVITLATTSERRAARELRDRRSRPVAPALLLFRFRSDRLRSLLLLLPVPDGGADRVLSQHRAVDLYRRQRHLLHDLRILDRQSLVDGLAFDPFGRQRRRCNRRAAAEGLELRVFDHVGFAIDLDLQLHDVAALRRAHESSAYVSAALVH